MKEWLDTVTPTQKRVGAAVVLLAIFAYYADWLLLWRDKLHLDPRLLQTGAIENGVAFLVVLWLAYVIATGHVSIWKLVNGYDKRASTSKFQPALWTALVIWAYVAVLTALWQAHPNALMPEYPVSVLIATGLAFITAAAAKVITGNNVSAGKEAKVDATTPMGAAPLFQNDAGEPELYKIQIMAFTLIAAAAYVASVLAMLPTLAGLDDATVKGTALDLPGISEGLLALMGIGTGAYLTRKFQAGTTTVLLKLLPDAVKRQGTDAERTITVTGVNLGDSQGATRVSIGANMLPVTPTDWTTTGFSFILPAKAPDGTEWPTEELEVRLTGTVESVNSLPLTVTL